MTMSVPNTFMQLQVLDWHYHMIIAVVDRRAVAMANWAAAASTHPVQPVNIGTMKVVYQYQYDNLKQATDQMVEMVDEGIDLARIADGQIRKALALQFPGQELLKVNYTPGPEQKAAGA